LIFFEKAGCHLPDYAKDSTREGHQHLFDADNIRYPRFPWQSPQTSNLHSLT
jgi:hypothetical protein